MFCPTCNYPLAQLPTPRCPECGRPFDPTNPKTYNTHPFTRLTHFALQGTGKLTTLALLLATLAILITTRWPLHKIPFSFIDLHYYGQFWRWPARLKHLTFWDAAYMTGLALLALATLHYLLRISLRLIATLHHRPNRAYLTPQRKHHLLTLTALAISTLAIGYGWPHRIGQRWAASEFAAWKTSQLTQIPGVYLRGEFPVSEPQANHALESLLRQGWTPRERLTGIRLLSPSSHLLSYDLIRSEKDPVVRAAQVRVLSINQSEKDLDFFLSLRNDPSDVVRAAAIDAIGLLKIPNHVAAFQFSNLQLNTTPPISFSVGLHVSGGSTYGPSEPNLPDLRPQLQQLMLTGRSSQERQAAARSLQEWPPPQSPNLRWAEWGVWIARDASLKPVRPADADIPPFVHTTGDSADSLKRYTNPIYDVTKPIVHLSADVPLVLDAQVKIRTGRTLYVFPAPDDYSVTAWMGLAGPGWRGPTTNPLNAFDSPALPPLKNPRLGYPWLNQPPRQVPGDYPIDIGVRWQSLIVSPVKQIWQNKPNVPDEPRFAWWTRLREIPTAAWLSNRDDSERFLYYDGPTLLRWPFTPHLENGQLTLRQTKPTNDPIYDRATQSIDPQCQAWLITVPNEATSNVQCSMLDVRPSPSPAPNEPTPYPFTSTPLQPPLAPHFLKELQSRGLNPHEAQALLDIWQKDFFQTKGARLLLFISQNAYDQFCPLEVTPKPDTQTRVGIIWHEFP